MQNHPPLPVSKTPKRLVQAKIDSVLFHEVEAEIESRGLTITAAVEWGLRSYLNTVKGKKK